MSLIECKLGHTVQTVLDHAYSFDRDRYGRFVARVDNDRHRAVFLAVEHYVEVAEVPLFGGKGDHDGDGNPGGSLPQQPEPTTAPATTQEPATATEPAASVADPQTPPAPASTEPTSPPPAAAAPTAPAAPAAQTPRPKRSRSRKG